MAAHDVGKIALVFDVVPHEHASRCHGAGFDELKLNPTFKRQERRHASPKQYRVDGKADLIDDSSFDERASQLTTPHDQDVPARLGFQPAYEIRCIVTDERVRPAG